MWCLVEKEKIVQSNMQNYRRKTGSKGKKKQEVTHKIWSASNTQQYVPECFLICVFLFVIGHTASTEH